MFCAQSCMQSLLFCHLCKYCITCVLWSKWWTVSIIDFFPPSIPKKEGRFATNSKVMMMVVVAVDVDDYHDKVVEGDDENFLHWPSSQADWWRLENIWQFILYSIHIGVICQVTHVSLVTRESCHFQSVLSPQWIWSIRSVWSPYYGLSLSGHSSQFGHSGRVSLILTLLNYVSCYRFYY